MKRILTIFVVFLYICIPSNAVLKERDLGHTLGVLRLELERNFKQQRSFLKRYEIRSQTQHLQLVEYMKKSEQISLILYSQRTDFTFDVAYACQQATNLYRDLHKHYLPAHQIQPRSCLRLFYHLLLRLLRRPAVLL